MATKAEKRRAAAKKREATTSSKAEAPKKKTSSKAAPKRERAKLLMGDTRAGVTPEPTTVEPVNRPSGAKYREKYLIRNGTWVTLADTENVPKELVGHEAFVVSAPIKVSDGDEQVPFRHEYQDEDTRFTVQTRDEYSAIVPNLTVKDFKDISYNGRTGLGHAG